jgi:hypothetical protein
LATFLVALAGGFAILAGTFFEGAFTALTGVNVVPIVGCTPLGRATDSFFAGRPLLVPRTGWRGVKIQPTPATGFPPISRPMSKSHGYWS